MSTKLYITPSNQLVLDFGPNAPQRYLVSNPADGQGLAFDQPLSAAPRWTSEAPNLTNAYSWVLTPSAPLLQSLFEDAGPQVRDLLMTTVGLPSFSTLRSNLLPETPSETLYSMLSRLGYSAQTDATPQFDPFLKSTWVQPSTTASLLATESISFLLSQKPLTLKISESAITTSDQMGPHSWKGLRNLEGSLFSDTLGGNALDNQLSGLAGNDSLRGYAGNDLLSGGAGDDDLRGGSGNDTLFGGSGQDRLYGDDGDDVLFDSEGPSTLIGGNGNDSMTGGDSADYLDGGSGADTMDGGNGADTYIVDSDADQILESSVGSGGSANQVIDTMYDYRTTGSSSGIGVGIEKIVFKQTQGANLSFWQSVSLDADSAKDPAYSKTWVDNATGPLLLKTGGFNDVISADASSGNIINAGKGSDRLNLTTAVNGTLLRTGSNFNIGGSTGITWTGVEQLFLSAANDKLSLTLTNFFNQTGSSSAKQPFSLYTGSSTNSSETNDITIDARGFVANRTFFAGGSAGQDHWTILGDNQTSLLHIQESFGGKDSYTILGGRTEIQEAGADSEDSYQISGGQATITDNSGSDAYNLTGTSSGTINDTGSDQDSFVFKNNDSDAQWAVNDSSLHSTLTFDGSGAYTGSTALSEMSTKGTSTKQVSVNLEQGQLLADLAGTGTLFADITSKSQDDRYVVRSTLGAGSQVRISGGAGSDFYEVDVSSNNTSVQIIDSAGASDTLRIDLSALSLSESDAASAGLAATFYVKPNGFIGIAVPLQSGLVEIASVADISQLEHIQFWNQGNPVTGDSLGIPGSIEYTGTEITTQIRSNLSTAYLFSGSSASANGWGQTFREISWAKGSQTIDLSFDGNQRPLAYEIINGQLVSTSLQSPLSNDTALRPTLENHVYAGGGNDTIVLSSALFTDHVHSTTGDGIDTLLLSSKPAYSPLWGEFSEKQVLHFDSATSYSSISATRDGNNLLLTQGTTTKNGFVLTNYYSNPQGWDNCSIAIGLGTPADLGLFSAVATLQDPDGLGGAQGQRTILTLPISA